MHSPVVLSPSPPQPPTYPATHPPHAPLSRLSLSLSHSVCFLLTNTQSQRYDSWKTVGYEMVPERLECFT